MLIKRVAMTKKFILFIIFTTLISFMLTCQKVDLTAPVDAVLSIVANPSIIDLYGDTSQITVLISKADGTQVPDGTVVNFTTNLGEIEQSKETKKGRARAMLTSGNTPGTATITARSGVTATQVSADVQIGYTVLNISVSANPASLPNEGGTSKITAVVFGENSAPLFNIPISFSADAGSLTSGGKVIRTNRAGEVKDTFTLSPSSSQVSTVTITATSGAISGSTVITIGEANEPPIPAFNYSPLNPEPGEEVFFNASESTDSDGYIASYYWDFGDGGKGSGKEASHKYSAANSYIATLTVTDDKGCSGATSQEIVVGVQENNPPDAVLEATPDSLKAPGGTVSLNAASSSDEEDGSNLTYEFSGIITGSGSVSISSGSANSALRTATISGASDGDVATFTVKVTDSDGVSSTAVVTVDITS